MLVVKILEGQVEPGVLLQRDDGADAEILGIGFTPPEAWETGCRLLSVREHPPQSLRAGDVLST